MKKPIREHRQELAENGVEQTLDEVSDWFDDVTEFFRDGAHMDVSQENLVEAVETLREICRPG